jgi:hypothetical protein
LCPIWPDGLPVLQENRSSEYISGPVSAGG